MCYTVEQLVQITPLLVDKKVCILEIKRVSRKLTETRTDVATDEILVYGKTKMSKSTASPQKSLLIVRERNSENCL